MNKAIDFLKKVPQYTRNARHARSVLQHGTPRKWYNLLLAETERKLRVIRTRSRPYLLFLDPCNYCNLRCPLCPTGLNDLGRPQSMLSLEHFKHYFEPHVDFLFEAYLHNWGESLINKNVYAMIEYAQSRNVGTNLSSNLVIADSDDLDNLIDCGLEYLVVSLDGTSQDTYSEYRVRGDYERVVNNLSELIRKRNARGRKRPFIEWQFIVMRHNEHQIDEATILARKLGVDLLRFIPVGMPFEFTNRKEVAERWFPVSVKGREESGQGQTFGQGAKSGPCFYLYRSMVVNPDGGVSPCCVVYRKAHDFAELTSDKIDIGEIWNNPKYRSARALFSPRQVENHTHSVCSSCDIFEWHRSKRSLWQEPVAAPQPIKFYRDKGNAQCQTSEKPH